MDIGEKLYVSSREAWRAWLAANHQDRSDIWLVIYKKGSGKEGVLLREAMDEALCFGWIDSQLKSIDAESYALRFTPRRKKSVWTPINKGRVLEMLREGLVTPAGIAVLPPDVLAAWEQEKETGAP